MNEQKENTQPAASDAGGQQTPDGGTSSGVGMYQSELRGRPDAGEGTDSYPAFLANIPASIWDMD